MLPLAPGITESGKPEISCRFSVSIIGNGSSLYAVTKSKPSLTIWLLFIQSVYQAISSQMVAIVFFVMF